jgi:hypothetical protein
MKPPDDRRFDECRAAVLSLVGDAPIRSKTPAPHAGTVGHIGLAQRISLRGWPVSELVVGIEIPLESDQRMIAPQ